MNLLRVLPFLIVFLFVSPVHAQLNSYNSLASQTNLEIQPRYPAPGETVEVSLNSYNSDLYNADIVWRLDGEVVASANNRREIEFVAGDLGDPTNVTVSIVRDGRVAQQFEAVIEPIFFDIVIEPQTRVPNFFAGRSLPSIGSQINVTALINNGELLTDELTYTWVMNGSVLDGGPIRGTNQVSFDTPMGSRINLSVSATDQTGAMVARRGIYFNSVRPEVIFYETNALHGASHTAITQTLNLVGDSVTLVAEPYYLDVRTYNNPDILEWKINNQTQPNASANPYRATIQRVNESGSARVNLLVRSTSQILQGAEDDIMIIF